LFLVRQWCLRMLLGISWHQHVRNDKVRRLTKQPHLSAIVQSRRLSLLGHIARMPDETDAKQISTASPLGNWTRPLGRPRITWMKTIQQDLKSSDLNMDDAVDLAQNGPIWRLMSTFGATHSWWCLPEMMMMTSGCSVCGVGCNYRFFKSWSTMLQWIGGLWVFSCTKWWLASRRLRPTARTISLSPFCMMMFSTQSGSPRKQCPYLKGWANCYSICCYLCCYCFWVCPSVGLIFSQLVPSESCEGTLVKVSGWSECCPD